MRLNRSEAALIIMAIILALSIMRLIGLTLDLEAKEQEARALSKEVVRLEGLNNKVAPLKEAEHD